MGVSDLLDNLEKIRVLKGKLLCVIRDKETINNLRPKEAPTLGRDVALTQLEGAVGKPIRCYIYFKALIPTETVAATKTLLLHFREFLPNWHKNNWVAWLQCIKFDNFYTPADYNCALTYWCVTYEMDKVSLKNFSTTERPPTSTKQEIILSAQSSSSSTCIDDDSYFK